jgi:hypothetical protein
MGPDVIWATWADFGSWPTLPFTLLLFCYWRTWHGVITSPVSYQLLYIAAMG